MLDVFYLIKLSEIAEKNGKVVLIKQKLKFKYLHGVIQNCLFGGRYKISCRSLGKGKCVALAEKKTSFNWIVGFLMT